MNSNGGNDKRGSNGMVRPDNNNAASQRMDNVRVHYNSAKPAQLSAHAYSQGTPIHIGPGQERHLPHEAWHAVQQKQGRVQPTTSVSGMPVNNNKGLEKEATRMATAAISAKSPPQK